MPPLSPRLRQLRARRLLELSTEDLFLVLLQGWALPHVVPCALERLERDPLTSAGRFPGDLLRSLIELPPSFWRREPALYRRYQAVVRAGAIARRRLSWNERRAFWSALKDRDLP